MILSRKILLEYLLPIYLVYSTICVYSLYFLGTIEELLIVLSIYILGLSIRPRVVKNNTESTLFFIGWGFVFMLSTVINGVRPGLILIYLFLFCYFCLCLNYEFLIRVFKKYVWMLSIFVLLSAIEYIIYMLTGRGIILSSVTRSTDVRDTNFFHLLFNVISYSSIPRFQGLFKEPGNMGTTCAFMLFATGKLKSMKIPFVIFLICGLLSLSMAYYAFLFIYLITNVKFSIKKLIPYTLVAILFLSVFRDNFERRIIERIGEADSIEDLDNRTTASFDRYFNRALSNGDLWFGVGANNLPQAVVDTGGNAGAKKWIYQFGIIGLMAIFFTYNVIYFRRCDKPLQFRDWVFIFVYWVCFYKSVVFTTPSLFIVYAIMPVINKLSVQDKLFSIEHNRSV